MAVDITGFNRMRRQLEKQREKEKQDVKEIKKELTYNELRALAKKKGIIGYGKMKKSELIKALEEC